MHKAILTAFILIAMVSAAAAAPDASVKDSSVQKIEKDISMMFKKSVENRDSSGKRKSKSTSSGGDSTQSRSNRQSAAQNQNSSADVSLGLDVLFASKLLQLEETTAPFNTCRILSSPKLPVDFGLSAELPGGGIDTIKTQFLSGYATNNGAVGSVGDVVAIKQYRNCLAEYGAIIGQSYLLLTSDLKELGISNQNIKAIGYDDFIQIAESAMNKAIADGISSKSVKRLYDQIINDKSTCYFDSSITNIKCGSTVTTIASKPVLTVAGVQMFGSSFSGFQGSYRLSRSWSLSDAIEQMKSNSKFERFSKEVSSYAENMESQGKSKEAAAARKKAIELTQGTDKSIGIGGMMPNVHQ